MRKLMPGTTDAVKAVSELLRLKCMLLVVRLAAIGFDFFRTLRYNKARLDISRNRAELDALLGAGTPSCD